MNQKNIIAGRDDLTLMFLLDDCHIIFALLLYFARNSVKTLIERVEISCDMHAYRVAASSIESRQLIMTSRMPARTGRQAAFQMPFSIILQATGVRKCRSPTL